jgi:IS30 family transposase
VVTIVERASGAPAASFTVSTRVNSKGADEFTAATIRLLAPYRDAVHTITVDNGK